MAHENSAREHPKYDPRLLLEAPKLFWKVLTLSDRWGYFFFPSLPPLTSSAHYITRVHTRPGHHHNGNASLVMLHAEPKPSNETEDFEFATHDDDLLESSLIVCVHSKFYIHRTSTDGKSATSIYHANTWDWNLATPS